MPSRYTRPPKPIESFGPELLTALLEGAKRKLEIPMPWKKAVYFRQRINQLRNAMRLKEHPQYPLVSQAKVNISWPPDTPTIKYPGGSIWPRDGNAPCVVSILPNDSEFKEDLEKVGVKVKDLTSDPLGSESSSETTTPEEEDDPLARLFRSQEVK